MPFQDQLENVTFADLLKHPRPLFTRMVHWVRLKNLPYSVEDVKKITSQCGISSEVKPRFYKHESRLTKATSLMGVPE